MEDKITIKKENILNAYREASEEQKALLENIFGKEILKPKNVMERIKTFHDAYCELGNKHPFVQAYRTAKFNIKGNTDVIAYLKLRIICAALNEGWKPKFDEDEDRYYSWFCIYTKEEYDKLDEDEKKECRVVCSSPFISDAYCGLVYANAFKALSFSASKYSPQFAFKTRELAEYCGKQFIDIWADYLFSYKKRSIN